MKQRLGGISMAEQMTLDIGSVKGKESTLFIVLNGEQANLSIEEIFDSHRFKKFMAISYVSSPRFFAKVVKGFEEVEFILGIDSAEQAINFNSVYSLLIDVNKRIDFIKEFDAELQTRVSEDKVKIRYCNTNLPIHTKLYLLENPDTGNTRVIIGSANLTERAFSGEKQYENIAIFDNQPEIFKIYLEWFKKLFSNSFDFVPEEIKKKIKQEKAQTIVLDKEEKANIVTNEIARNLYHIVPLSQEIFEEWKASPQNIQYQAELQANEVRQKTQIIAAITKKDGKVYRLKPPQEIRKMNIVVDTLVSNSLKEDQLQVRQKLIYWDKNDLIYIVSEDNKTAEFSQKAEKDEIKTHISLITEFVEAYRKFTVTKEDKHLGKVMEAILYAFMSVYLWKIREDLVIQYGGESYRANVPIFLVLGGRAYSGKTTALEIIGMLLGNYPPYFISYDTIRKGNVADRELLEGFFGSEYLAPILVDEMPISFFTGRTGENIIKNVSNNAKGKHPVMICTTNMNEFNVPQQILRRIYYLQIDSEFDKRYNLESQEHLTKIRRGINSTLFKDFTYRMGELIREGEPLYLRNDYLYAARKIFEEYYRECKMDLPEWFPKKPFNDYEERGKRWWQEKYKHHKELFQIRPDGTIYVEINELFKDPKEKDFALNMLGPGCINESSHILILNEKEFFEYIGEKKKLNPVIRLIKGLVKS